MSAILDDLKALRDRWREDYLWGSDINERFVDELNALIEKHSNQASEE